MWADTLFTLERSHVLRLGVWALLSLLVGTGLLLWLNRKNENALFIKHFAIQSLAWGAVELVFAMRAWAGLTLRDYASATQFQQLLWMNVGLDVGYVAVGVTLVLASLQAARRTGVPGAGAGVVVQGIALLVLHIRLLTLIGPSR